MRLGVDFNLFYCYEIPSGDFVAVGYTQHHLCRQPHAKMAIYGVSTQLTWVDAANIKINPTENAVQVGGSY